MNPPALTSAFVETSRARPLLAWSHAQQVEVQEHLRQLLLSWQAAWGLADAAMSTSGPTVQAADTPLADRQTVLWRFDDAPTADLSQPALRALQSALFGETAHLSSVSGPAVIAPEIAQIAWSDWQHRLASTLGAPLSAWSAETETNYTPSPWSGTLSAKLTWCKTRCTLLLPGYIVQKLVRPAEPRRALDPQPLAHLADALRDQHLNVQARLRDVTLTLGELEHLSPGDVVLLPHRLETPLHVLGPDDEALCNAWLGQQAGRIALELSPLATSV